MSRPYYDLHKYDFFCGAYYGTLIGMLIALVLVNCGVVTH